MKIKLKWLITKVEAWNTVICISEKCTLVEWISHRESAEIAEKDSKEETTAHKIQQQQQHKIKNTSFSI